MDLVNRVKILDISLGGVSLKTDKKLEPGREYQITLGDGKKSIDMKGVIVRSEVCGTETRANGEKVSLYATGMRFDGTQTDKLSLFLHAVDQKKKKVKAPLVAAERRLSVRFQIDGPGVNMLSAPSAFKVKTISMSGMLIETDQPLEIGRCIPMGVALWDDPLNIVGRVVMCRIKADGGRTFHDIGVEFMQLTEKDKKALKAFTDNLAMAEAGGAGRKDVNE